MIIVKGQDVYSQEYYYKKKYKFFLVDPITSTAIILAGATGVVIVGSTIVVMVGGATLIAGGAALAAAGTVAVVTPAVVGAATMTGSTALLGISSALVAKGLASEAAKGAKSIKGFFHKHTKSNNSNCEPLINTEKQAIYPSGEWQPDESLWRINKK